MTPTNKLRWIRRGILENAGRPCVPWQYLNTVWVLQQWWEASHDEEWDKGLKSEWRDIPVEYSDSEL